MCFTKMNPIFLSMHHVLKSPALTCNLGSTTYRFLLAVWVIVVYVRLQMEWHVVYKYKEPVPVRIPEVHRF